MQMIVVAQCLNTCHLEIKPNTHRLEEFIMKKQIILLAIALLLATFSAFAQVKLKYSWSAGDTYRFEANQVDDITMSAMGMDMEDTFNTNTVFSLKVANVLANGNAEGMLYIESFSVTDKSGATVASLQDIPAEALKSLVEVDTKGKFTFKKIVYLIVEDGRNMLVSADAKADQNSASASAQVGDQKLSIHAEFDPKSGTLKAGYSMETVKQPEPKTIKVKEDAQRIDVLPLAFLDLLVLPEESVVPESTFSVKMMEYVFTTNTNDVEGGIVDLDLNIKTDRSQGSSTDQMDDMMCDMGSMDMGGELSMDMSGGAPKTDLNGDISYKFDISKGIFNTLSGKITNRTKGMGLDLKAVTTLQMRLL